MPIGVCERPLILVPISKRETEPAQVFTLFRGLPSSHRDLDLVAPVAYIGSGDAA
jgi:hypothetical protein